MSENNKESSVEPRSSVRPVIDEEIRKNSPKKRKSQKKSRELGGLGKVGVAATLITTSVVGANAFTQESSHDTSVGYPNPIVEQAPKRTNNSGVYIDINDDVNSETERAIYEKTIEEEYGVSLVGMREGYEKADIKFDEFDEKSVGPRPPVRWTMKELRGIDTVLNLLPTKLIEPIDGKNLTMFSADYIDTDCDCAGASYGETGVVGFAQGSIGDEDIEGNLSLVVHELMHRLDALTKHEIDAKVREILGDSDFLNSEFMKTHNQLSDIDMFDARRTLGSFAPYESFDEGIAGFSQIYVKGYERFMNALGPMIDGNKDVELIGADLSLNYPKTQNIYKIYQEFVFDGKEYDEYQKKLNPDLKYSKAGQVYENENAQLQSKIDRISEKYNVIVYPSSIDIWTPDDVSTVESIVKLFPKKIFHSSIHSNRFAVILSRETESVQHTGDTVMLSPSSIAVEAGPYIQQLKAVDIIAHEYAHRVNMEKEFKPEQKLIDLLGGDEFLDGSEKLYPKIFEKDENGDFINKRFFTNDGLLLSPDELLPLLAEEYLKGYAIYRNTQNLFNSENYSQDDLSTEEFKKKERKSKGYEIFELIKDEIFDGREYDSAYKIIPEITERIDK